MIVKRRTITFLTSQVKLGLSQGNGPSSAQLCHFGIVPERGYYPAGFVTLEGVYTTLEIARMRFCL